LKKKLPGACVLWLSLKLLLLGNELKAPWHPIYTIPTLKIVKEHLFALRLGDIFLLEKYVTFFLQSKTPLPQGKQNIDLLEDSRSWTHFLIKWIMHQL